MSVLGALGDLFLKMASRHSTSPMGWFALGVLAYASTAPGWFFVIRRLPLAEVGAIYAFSTVLLLAGLDILWFHHRLTSVEWFGIALSVASLVALRRVL